MDATVRIEGAERVRGAPTRAVRSAPDRHPPQVLMRLQATAGNQAVAGALTATRPASPIQVQRGGKGGAGGGTAAGDVGIPGGGSATASDQGQLATGYKARPDGTYDTPDGRVVPETQAKDESLVVNSAGIFMAAYLARYNKVKSTYGLGQADLDKLSQSAGFLKQFKTGDVVLRQMDAADSQGLAKVTNSQYSHSGIIKAEGGRVQVLDSYRWRPGENHGQGRHRRAGLGRDFRAGRPQGSGLGVLSDSRFRRDVRR